MIAPTFESLATKYSKPKRIAFAKIDVDKLRDVASQHGVRAMPTFIIFKNGSPIETIQGANPPKLTQAVENAIKVAGPSTSSGFGAPGRTLGGSGAGRPRQSLQRPIQWDLNNFINAIIGFFGLYLVSLFSVGGFGGSQPFYGSRYRSCLLLLTLETAVRSLQGRRDLQVQCSQSCCCCTYPRRCCRRCEREEASSKGDI